MKLAQWFWRRRILYFVNVFSILHGILEENVALHSNELEYSHPWIVFAKFGWNCSFVYLFGVIRPTREFFTHLEMSWLPMTGCKFWHLPALIDFKRWKYQSLACHTHCDTGHPSIMVISEDPWHSHLMQSVWKWSCHYLVCHDWDSNTQPSACVANALAHFATAAAVEIVKNVKKKIQTNRRTDNRQSEKLTSTYYSLLLF